MQFEFHVCLQGHAYLYSLGKNEDPVIVFRAAFSNDGKRYPGECNVRKDRAIFLANEALHWPSMGYHRLGRLKLNGATTREHVKQRFDALLPALDALWHARSIPATSQGDYPGNNHVLEAAAEYLRQDVLNTVLAHPALPSRYEF